MAPPADDALPTPPVAPTAKVWRAMSPEARQRFLDQVIVAFSEPLWNEGNGQAHTIAKQRAVDRLRGHFNATGRRIFLAEGELSVLYPGEPAFCPDILAVLDVAQPEDDERMAWVVADEGRGLDLVIEVIYEGYRKKDLVDNVERYARLGIPEYFVYDRKKQELHGHRLPTPDARRYQRIVPQAGRRHSTVLGLDLAIVEGKLEFFHGMAALFGTEDLLGRLQGMMQSLEAKAEQASAQAEQALTSLQDSLLAIVAARGLACSDSDRERVRSCADPERLQRWLVRAATVGSM
ncbi:MAG TPA: Uma2 family endonuclease, partial [Polyangium sp.]|nr:Uma2 family endonuclease [Polyangium sp.]